MTAPRTAPDYLADRGPGRGRRSPARSWLHSDAPALSLNGEWDFRLLPTADGPVDFVEPGFAPGGAGGAGGAEDGGGWARMPVPAHWVLQEDGRWGRPIYTNVQYPFPIEPPFVPDENPTGDYRRTFEVPASFGLGTTAAERVLLRFDGVESMYRVWLNGTEVGVGVGSRLAQEFDVTALLVAGENVLAVRVHQWSAASYLEDQDQWWLPGIFRDVTLQARPASGIDDLWLRASYDVDGGRGILAAEISAAASAFPVRVVVDELDVDVTWHSAEAVAPIEIGSVEPWSAEVPRLYEVRVSAAAAGPAAAPAETITQRVGFRTVEIRGDRLLVNGRRVVFHGVNRHETHPERGRVFDEEHARADLAMMKRFNVNAIRTSHYPPHPRVLDLADELGFWVIDECDLETHGFEQEDGAGGGHATARWTSNPSDDPAWSAAYLDRIERTVERDKNHPSVILWSLGNESGTGANLAAMSAWVHARDSGRPVHYEGDYTGAYTDVYSRMYPSLAETEAIGTDGSTAPLLACSPADGARQRTKPFLLCEYVHAMGAGPGAIDAYEALAERHPRLHGGFVWEWRDHGLLTRTDAGVPFFGYGGDFGEVVHDGNFVMDGLVLSDGTPSPGLHEYAAVVQPLRFTFFAEARAGARAVTPVLRVENLRHSADTRDLRLLWRVERDGEVVAEGELDARVRAGGREDVVLSELPLGEGGSGGSGDSAGSDDAGGEVWLHVDAALREESAWAPAGHVVARGSLALSELGGGGRAARAARAVRDVVAAAGRRSSGGSGGAALSAGSAGPAGPVASSGTTGDEHRVGPARFERGRLVALGDLAVAGPRVELWRAPTDNDEGGSAPSAEWTGAPDDPRAHVPVAELWRRQGLDRLVHRVEEIEAGAGRLRTVTRTGAANARASVRSTTTWTTVSSGGRERLALVVEIEPSEGWTSVWPRLGIRFDLPDTVAGVSWFGTGPHESYPDSRRSARVGRFAAGIAELGAEYGRPQETGHRSDLRELELTDAAGGSVLRLEAVPDHLGRRPGFTLSAHTAQEVTAADHPHELPPSRGRYLYIDAAQHGLGSRACGPDVQPEHALRPQARTLTLLFG